MKKSRYLIFCTIWVLVMFGMLLVQNNRFKKAELSHKHNYGQQSFGIMMYINKEMRTITDKYESGLLTDENLINHYNRLDDFILSVYNQQPFAFITNIRRVRLIKRRDVVTFDQNMYDSYIELINFFDSTYHEAEDNYVDNEFLDFYNVYSDSKFNDQLSDLISNLNN